MFINVLLNIYFVIYFFIFLILGVNQVFKYESSNLFNIVIILNINNKNAELFIQKVISNLTILAQ